MKLPRLPLPRIRIPIDVRDAHVYGGLALAAIGGWQLSASWTCVAVGLALTLFGVFAPRRKAS